MANLCKSARIWVRLHWTTETQVNVMVTLRDYTNKMIGSEVPKVCQFMKMLIFCAKGHKENSTQDSRLSMLNS